MSGTYRNSVEAAFKAYWPPPWKKGDPMPVKVVDNEPVDLKGLGSATGWSQFYQGTNPQVQCRVAADENHGYIQFKNGSKSEVKVAAQYGGSRFRITLRPGQSKDLRADGSGETWHWDVF
jgi:hypothetical protein